MLNPKNLGLAAGIIWAAVLFLMTILSIYTGYAADFLKMVESIYPWYGISWGGAFVGIALGFIDGFIGGYLVAWLYNRFGR